MGKSFSELNTQEIANLNENDIAFFVQTGISEEEIRSEIATCKKILRSIGM